MAININDYSKFVDTTTSDESKHSIAFIGRVHSLTEENRGINLARLMTSAIGMMAVKRGVH